MLNLTLGKWVMELAANWILSQVEAGGVALLAANLRDLGLEWLDTKRDAFVEILKKEAALRWPDTELDEAVIAAVESFLDTILPQK